jgi:hypothetical protein
MIGSFGQTAANMSDSFLSSLLRMRRALNLIQTPELSFAASSDLQFKEAASFDANRRR